MNASGGRHCISCGAPLGREDALCPTCGALNTRGVGATGRPYRKRLRFLWWTYTVRGTRSTFVEAESYFGVTISYSLARWVWIHVLGISFVTAIVILWLAGWAATRNLLFIGWATLFALLDTVLIGWFVWSMTPPRKAI